MNGVEMVLLAFSVYYIARQMGFRGNTGRGKSHQRGKGSPPRAHQARAMLQKPPIWMRALCAVKTGWMWVAQFLPYRGSGFHGWVTCSDLDAPLSVNDPFFIHMCRLYGPPCDWPREDNGDHFGLPADAFDIDATPREPATPEACV